MVRSKILAQNYKTDQEIEIKEAIIGLLSVSLKSSSNASRFCTELFSAIWQKIRKFSIWPACLKKSIKTKPTGWSGIEMVSNIQRHRSVVLLGRLCPAHKIIVGRIVVCVPPEQSHGVMPLLLKSLCQGSSDCHGWGQLCSWAALCQLLQIYAPYLLNKGSAHVSTANLS